MKLVQIEDVKEGESYPVAFLSFGRKLDRWRDTSTRNGAEVWLRNGWYMKIILPFKSERIYDDPHTFTSSVKVCRLSGVLWSRTPRNQTKSVRGWSGWQWIPA